MTKQRILCVGGSGFIASNLALALENSERYETTVADVWDAKLKLRFENSPFTFSRTDITRDDEHLLALIEAHDVVFNLASQVYPELYVRDPLSVVHLNLIHGSKVIDACVRFRRRLVHFSTSEVYGKAIDIDTPFSEDSTDCTTGPVRNQRWIYSCTKQLLDRIIFAYGNENRLDYTIVRPFNAVGPLTDHIMAHMDDGCPRVFAQFMSALIHGYPMRLVDGGTNRRCFTSVDDVVDALLFILERPDAFNREIVNIGNPENEITIRGLAEMMHEIYGEKFADDGTAASTFEFVSGEEFYGTGYEDTARRLPDISKLTRAGWRPRVGLRELLERTMEFSFRHKDRLTPAALEIPCLK